MLPPLSLGPVEAGARATAARNWLASLSVPASTRAAATTAFDAVAKNNFKNASRALKMLVEAGKAQLDQASLTEMAELVNQLAAASALPTA